MQFEEMVALLPDYLEGKLSPKLAHVIEQELQTSRELQDSLQALKSLKSMSHEWHDESLPNWHRTAFLARRQKSNTGWLPWLSMATSFAAILLVLFRIEIVSSNDGLHIGFGQPTSKVAVAQQSQQDLEIWRDELQAYVGLKFLEYENQQLRRDQQMMQVMLELNTEQRRQDLTQLTAFLAQQRNQDIELTQSQYQALYEIQDQDRQKLKQLYVSLDKDIY